MKMHNLPKLQLGLEEVGRLLAGRTFARGRKYPPPVGRAYIGAEAFRLEPAPGGGVRVVYRHDGEDKLTPPVRCALPFGRWLHPRDMPPWAARWKVVVVAVQPGKYHHTVVMRGERI